MRLQDEPTTYFALIAALLFVLSIWGSTGSQPVLQLSQPEIDAQLLMQEIAQGEALSETQRDQVIESYIEQQLLVAEAKAQGLDRDSRIDNILAQKMRHVLSRDVIQPSDEELQRFYSDNSERYRVPTTYDFEELVFNRRRELPETLFDSLRSGADASQLLQMEPGGAAPLNRVSALDLRNIFNPDFAELLLAAAPGEWVGPFISNRGQHWLRLTETREGSLPPLAEIDERVRLDWIAVEEDRRLQQSVNELRSSYRIEIGANGADHD